MKLPALNALSNYSRLAINSVLNHDAKFGSAFSSPTPSSGMAELGTPSTAPSTASHMLRNNEVENVSVCQLSRPSSKALYVVSEPFHVEI